MTRTQVSLVGMVAARLLVGCGGGPETGADGAAELLLTGQEVNGDHLFGKALPGTNGRACTTCHVEEDHTTLLPATVAARLAADPSDPLFNPIDADDPTAAEPTYRHLLAGLVRVTLPLPPNVDLVDAAGNLVTPEDRTISLWRGVPTIENTAVTAPYQYDGRAPTLEDQALGALHAHSQIDRDPPDALVRKIADYERTISSPPSAPGPFPAGSDEALGQMLFQRACTQCHGGSSGNKILFPVATLPLHPALNADGSVSLPTNFCFACTDDDDLDIGISFRTSL